MDLDKVDLVVSGDCGGTNTRLSLWSIPKGQCKVNKGNCAPGVLVSGITYRNSNYDTFVQVMKTFLKESGCQKAPVSCCLACAGPILNNFVSFTNVDFGWEINGAHLQVELQIRTVHLINDFAAMGYGLLTLSENEYVTLHDVPRDPAGPIATVGAGTGLGECYLTPNGSSYTCFCCEGGHADFSGKDPLEHELTEYLKRKFGEKNRISTERVVSGPGLANVFSFLAQKFPEKVNKQLQTTFENAGENQGAVVAQNSDSDDLCNHAMEIFISAYGREAGNAALKYIPTGGFYLTGGLAPKNLKKFTEGNMFMDAFFDKGRVTPALKNIPVYLVLNDKIGERGAHLMACQLLVQTQGSVSEN